MSKSKVKVLHLLSSDRFSGAENVVFQIINLFSEDDFDMVYSSKDGQISESCKKENIKFYPLKKVTFQEVSKVIKKFKPDIIHAHDVRASVIASFFSNKSRIVSHMHVNHEEMKKINFKSLVYLARASKFEHIFWVSDSAFDNYRFNNFIAKKSSILYNVIDLKKIIAKSKQDFKKFNYDIVYLGRLSYQKNPERLIKVLNKAIEMNKDLKIAIIGTGDLEENTRNIVVDKKLSENISFLGFQSNPLKILKDAKVMLMTSRYEGTPMVALEAMALGIPIVSTPVDGLVNVIQNGITGYLSDNDDVLASKILEIVQNNYEYNRLSKNTLKYFDEINNVADYYSKIHGIYHSN